MTVMAPESFGGTTYAVSGVLFFHLFRDCNMDQYEKPSGKSAKETDVELGTCR